MAVSLAFGFLFIPSPDASYETVTIGGYRGVYNSAWIGAVSALMASTFVSLLGFYVINNSLKTDIDTKVGQIVASTRVSNFSYLISKVFSNFLVLATMVLLMAFMNIGLFFLYSSGHSFDPLDFILAYLLIPIPTMFFIAGIAVVLEVLFKQKSTLQNVGYFFIFAIFFTQTTQDNGLGPFDPLGSKIATTEMTAKVNAISGETLGQTLNIGFRIGNLTETQSFVFEGIHFSIAKVGYRLLWPLITIILVGAASPFFHRFNLKGLIKGKKKKEVDTGAPIADLDLNALPKPDISYALWPLLKTELLLLVRQGNRWLWLLNFIGIAFLIFLEIEVAHNIVLPILWFLQVTRWSELTTKEQSFNVHQFTFAAYKPISRVYASQLTAGIVLGILLAFPLIVRHLMAGDLNQAVGPILGSIFIIGLSAISGIISQGKKLFEILFFFLIYGNVNGIPFLDYFAGMHSSPGYLGSILIVCVALISLSVMNRKKQLRSQ
ncbi:hypothetical protein [Roseivirga sp.]|uniref:hypothetical protein n=1 Tax=Roseivirga sp. TaxID=1964215 RepID=UPI003B8E093C